jgi:hypothetical protein
VARSTSRREPFSPRLNVIFCLLSLLKSEIRNQC